ncbi:MAG: 50S ribosomal protein L19, partial [Clostridia bacterium]|nr:50S ribosomal protein L19 [Clostridia bacterium]
MNIIDTLEQEGMKKDLPELRIGDQVKVNVKVIEGTRERIQTYEGIIIAKKNGGIRETIVVRRVTFGVGVERTFPIHSPKIAG